MPKKYRVKRASYTHGVQVFNSFWLGVIVIVLCGGIGWVSFDPIASLVANISNDKTHSPSSLETPTVTSNSVTETVDSSSMVVDEEEHIMKTTALPESMYYLPPHIVNDMSMLRPALANIKAMGGTGVVFDVKDKDGYIHYNSQLEIVKNNFKAIPAMTYDLKQVMDEMKKNDLVPVASVSAFKDQMAAFSLHDSSVKYQNSKVNWLDNASDSGGKTWLNPNHTQAQDYILQIIEEITQMGVTHVSLHGVQFPTGYSLNLATYGNTGVLDKSQVLADFLIRAEQVAAKNDSQIWPVIGLDAMAGVNDIPYGDHPEKLLEVTKRGMIDVRPDQFGNGVTTEELTISTPILLPYDAIVTGLDATVDMSEYQIAAVLQAYTAPFGDHIPYGTSEIALQADAVEKYGIESLLYYNPQGVYGV